MAVLSGNRIAWGYTSDNGITYRVAAQKAMTDQGKLGGAAAAADVPPKPAGMRMRRITVHAAGVGSRTVPVYDNTAPILANGETVNANFGGDSHTFTSSGNPIPEGHRRQSVTTQST